ncbi:MAG: DUF4097 family beta strand repeat-containing protein [Pyrinomonadaceae bacterium]
MAVKKLKIFVFAISLCMGGAVPIVAQKPVPTPKPKVDVWNPPAVPNPPKVSRETNQTTEKFITVDPNVNVKLCVSEGTLKINGWERNEVRVFVRSGRLAGFKVLEKDAASGRPNWLLIANMAPEGARPAPLSECLAGRSIEIDVPMKTSLNLTGRAAETVIDSVKKVSIKIIEGDISVRNISEGISAATYQGDLIVENSGGSISAETTTGNILAYGVTPGQIGDLFKAKTGSGNVSIQQAEHRQIEASSISGSVNFDGKFLSGGLYNFKTSNGSIRMQIPARSSCTIKASYGFGTFNSEIPLKYVYENVSPAGKNFQATVGSGDANINLTTNTGSILIKKQ